MRRSREAVGLVLLALTLAGCGVFERLMPSALQPASPAPPAATVVRPTPPEPERAVVERPAPERPEPAAARPAPGQVQLEEQVARTAGEVNELQNALARVIASSRRQDTQLQVIERRLAELAARSRDGAGGAPPGFAPSGGRPVPSSGSSSLTTRAEDLYGTGLEKLRAGQHDAAVLTFYELIANYPTHPLRENAQFQVADILYGQKDLRGALAEWEALAVEVPDGRRVPDALLKIGLCHRGLGDETRARKTWERLVKEHPGSAAARQAQSLLRGSRPG